MVQHNSYLVHRSTQKHFVSASGLSPAYPLPTCSNQSFPLSLENMR